MPDATGKPSTIRRRVRFEDEILKLIGPDSESALGKLISASERQMVLSRDEGQMTFVRI